MDKKKTKEEVVQTQTQFVGCVEKDGYFIVSFD